MPLKLKEAFSSLSRKLGDVLSKKELTEDDIDGVFDEVQVSLLEGDVAYEVVEMLRDILKKELAGLKISRFSKAEKEVKEKIADSIKRLLMKGVMGSDIIQTIKDSPKPYLIVFMGVNGVGKTTTIAKVAYLLLKNRLKPVIVAADTFRAGAQEQLEIHARNLGLPFIKGKYGADPAAVAKDGVIHAERKGYPVVLIDTAGRMHTDRNLMEEIRKVVRVVKPSLKLLVLDALTGNDAISQARWFDKAVGVDAVILTKLDADAKGGSALSIILTIEKPIMFVGVGQEYDDLVPYEPSEILNKLLGE